MQAAKSFPQPPAPLRWTDHLSSPHSQKQMTPGLFTPVPETLEGPVYSKWKSEVPESNLDDPRTANPQPRAQQCSP